MKKYFVILLVCLFLLAGCNSPYFTGNFDYDITNKSDFDISLSFVNDESIYTIKSGKTETFKINDNKGIKLLNNPRASAQRITNSNDYEIINMSYKTISVTNIYTECITLFEANGMIGDSFGDVFIINPNETKIIKVYTENPVYMAKFTQTGLNANIALLSFN